MKSNHFLYILAILFFQMTSCQKQSDIDYSLYELKFEDNFDGNQLDLKKWAYRTDNKHRSVQLKENVEIGNGYLTLHLKQLSQPLEGKLATGAGIVSRERFRYGYYEVRAKLGNGIDSDQDGEVDEGWHHSFWAMAAEIDGDEVATTYPGIRRTEIDCFENSSEHGEDPGQKGLNRFTQHVIIWNEKGKEVGRLPKPPADLTRIKDFQAIDWHTYAFEWTDETLRFFVDGKETHSTSYSASEYEHDYINVWLTAISANWNKEGAEDSQAIYDYFRYYSFKK